MDDPRSATGDRDAPPSAKPESLDEIARMLFAPSAAEEGHQPASDDDYRALYENLLGGQGRVEPATRSPASRFPEPPPEQHQPQPHQQQSPTDHPTPTGRPGASSLVASDARPPVRRTPEPRRPVARRSNPTKTTYRDAPKPLNGRVYNPVRFRSHYNPFDRGTRATPRQGEAREFSGHADEAGSIGEIFRVYIIDDVEHKKGVERDCRLLRHHVHDIVWGLPEWVNRNGRTVHGVPPTPTDEYEVRINPAHAGAPLSEVPMHDRTRVFLTVRNPPPTGPLVPFTVAPIPTPGEPAGLTVIDRVRRALDAADTPDTRAVVTARGEPLDCLDPNRDLVNLGQEVSLAVHARHMLAVRTALVARRFLVKDAMFRERALHIGPMSPALLQREAAGLVDRCRANGIGEDEIVLSAEMPLRTYVIMRLAELGSERYNDAYLANPRFREEFKDRGPARLSPPQTEQLSDAFYWVHLAPEDRRVPKFEEVIRFYQQRGVEVRLNRPHVKSGASVGRTSESGALRSFKQHSMVTHSVLQSKYKILAPSGEVQALRTVKPRTKAPSAVERNPAAARIDGLAAAAAAARRHLPLLRRHRLRRRRWDRRPHVVWATRVLHGSSRPLRLWHRRQRQHRQGMKVCQRIPLVPSPSSSRRIFSLPLLAHTLMMPSAILTAVTMPLSATVSVPRHHRLQSRPLCPNCCCCCRHRHPCRPIRSRTRWTMAAICLPPLPLVSSASPSPIPPWTAQKRRALEPT